MLVGSPGFGLVFPTEYGAGAQTVPAPPAVTMISPVVPLLVMAYEQPLPGYGVRPTATVQQQVSKGLANGGFCQSTSNGGVICTSNGSPFLNVQGAQPAGSALPSGLFTGWQYWQASIVMQLMICAAALAISAFLLPPIRRFKLRRQVPVTAPV
jgi:hypothetical protein